MKKYLIISLLFISCNSKDSEVIPVRVLDGDTFVTADKEHIRLYDIDAPELTQFYGYEAKEFTSKYILGKTIYIERKGKDKYGRTLANVRLMPHASTVNELLVLRGYAWTSGKFCANKQLEEDMSYAREMKQGLWAFENVPPYIYRKNHKK